MKSRRISSSTSSSSSSTAFDVISNTRIRSSPQATRKRKGCLSDANLVIKMPTTIRQERSCSHGMLPFLFSLVVLLCSFVQVEAQDQPAPPPQPHLNGRHFRITALEENGFLNMHDTADTKFDNSRLDYSGYLIEMIHAIAQPQRANFTYDLLPPSGTGSLCNPRLDSDNSSVSLYSKEYRTQYNCGTSDVNDLPLTNYSTDMYLGLYYVTPARQLQNQFTIPFLPPFSGTLAMFGTAVEIPDFPALVQAQRDGVIKASETCGPAGTALIDSVAQSYPGLVIRGIYGGEEEIYQAFFDQSCKVYITDGPIAAQFVLRQSRKGQCVDVQGNPIGVIGEPMEFGLSHYAIGIRRDIPAEVVNTMSYWMNILMTCNPLDLNGPCPDGNFASFYSSSGGTGDECGYVLYPPKDSEILSAGAIAGIVLGSVFVVIAVCTLWHRHHMAQERHRYHKKSQAALRQAQRERDFNEYLAHEIRNPLASSLAALTFVSSKTSDPDIIPSEEHRSLIKADVNVIDSSLQYVNDLLRNLLDLHRTTTAAAERDETDGMQPTKTKTIKLNVVPTDVMKDILEPVSTILFMRGANVEIQTECRHPHLAVMVDRMRLKQILLNLAANSSKFVTQGYIKLRAEIAPETGTVVLYVEDSGPGIPLQKRKQLFVKFQDSLDVLNQGTGIGLCVCKNLSEVMGAKLYLDESFDSGIPGFPGTRFTLELQQSPLEMDGKGHFVSSSHFSVDESKDLSLSISRLSEDLPQNLKVLFADDDLIIRKMFGRVLHMVAPSWTIREAANGETALLSIEEEDADIVFIDQYMASVEKQMLGTETVQALRARGYKGIICGLSANDNENEFLQAGANAFMPKPFPCQKEAMREALQRMLYSGNNLHLSGKNREQCPSGSSHETTTHIMDCFEEGSDENV